MKMDYTQWAQEYVLEQEKLKKKLTSLRAELRERLKSGEEGVYLLKRRIVILNSMYIDCKNIANILMERGRRLNVKEACA